MIHLKPITNSSMVAGHGYDPDARMLAILFVGNPSPTYYREVPEEVAEQFASAPSLGKAFHQLIKGKFVGQPATESAPS
ncbi:KTSC domain containing protein [uncultured Caudovirales phage]|uniref:KTSC domain containing protein n=1 Tax=uncultured Caudovirales phage TaxID=2100421 RepID=A0A6J5NHN6_9CAUD|nr:KTSC domain containing protein [uncultured Caudovirales phage]